MSDTELYCQLYGHFQKYLLAIIIAVYIAHTNFCLNKILFAIDVCSNSGQKLCNSVTRDEHFSMILMEDYLSFTSRDLDLLSFTIV